MRITESLIGENDRRGYQEVCSDCEAYGLKKHGLTRSDCCISQLVNDSHITLRYRLFHVSRSSCLDIILNKYWTLFTINQMLKCGI